MDCRQARAWVVAAVAAALSAACASRVSTGVATPESAPPACSAAQLAGVSSIDEIAVSPDGREVAFASDRSGAVEVWTVALDRPGATPVQRTRFGERVSGLSWAPDGSFLVFEMDHGGDERPDLYRLPRGAADATPLTRTPDAEQNARVSPDGKWLAFEVDAERPFHFAVARIELASGRREVLTHEAINVVGPRWSPDGARIAATRTPDDQQGDLLFIDVATATSRVVAAPRAHGILSPVDFLPDGRLVARATNERGFHQLALVTAAGAVTFVGRGDWDVEHARVAGDDVYATRNVGGRSQLVFGTIEGDALRERGRVDANGVYTDLGADARARAVVLVRESGSEPSSLVRLDDDRAGTTPLVAPKAAGVHFADFNRLEERAIPSFDGTPIHNFVLRPRVPRLGTPPPVVVRVHGGPGGQVKDDFHPLSQALAEAGFVVVAPNYRGSHGYGDAFEDLNNKDWGGGDLGDLVAVVEALAREGVVDGKRVGVTGGSYGGYLTLRAITARPTFFGAAVESFGMPDLVKDYALTADRYGSWYATEMGDPVHDAALFRERSPIHFLDRVVAPLLVFQGENDTDVPRVESDEVVASLRARSRTVDYVVYPNEGHDFTHRENRVDAMTRTVEFFVRHLGERARATAP